MGLAFGADIIYEQHHAGLVLHVLGRILAEGRAQEACLVTGIAENRVGVAELNKLLNADENVLLASCTSGLLCLNSAAGCGSSSVQLSWTAAPLPEVEPGRPFRLYSFRLSG